MKLLKKLYYYDAKSSSKSLMTFIEVIRTLCLKRGAKVDQDKAGNLYVTKGKSKTYPCIAAHMDEVHENRGKNFRVVTDGEYIFGFDDVKKDVRHGIGADDKNGIWVALRCLETCKKLKVVFFVDEEVGCVGSSQCDMKFFEDVRFVLQVDRKGNSDFIVNGSGVELCDAEFIRAVQPEKWGYASAEGMLTDVVELKENGLNVACCNMSCGYYNPHTKNEFTVFSDLKKCLRFVRHIIKDCTNVYHHEYEYKYSGGWYGSCYSGHSGKYGIWDDDTDTGKKKNKSDNKNDLKKLVRDAISKNPDKKKFDILDAIYFSGASGSYREISDAFDEVVAESFSSESDELKDEYLMVIEQIYVERGGKISLDEVLHDFDEYYGFEYDADLVSECFLSFQEERYSMETEDSEFFAS